MQVDKMVVLLPAQPLLQMHEDVVVFANQGCDKISWLPSRVQLQESSHGQVDNATVHPIHLDAVEKLWLRHMQIEETTNFCHLTVVCNNQTRAQHKSNSNFHIAISQMFLHLFFGTESCCFCHQSFNCCGTNLFKLRKS